MTRTDAGRARCGGFTYLWVLLLVALMGVGLTVAVEIDSVAAQRERERELLAIGRQFRAAIGRYYETQLAGGRREYPASLEDLLSDNRAPGIKRYLRKIFVDPMTGKAEWGLLRVSGRIVGVHSLSEREPIKQEGFEPEDMSFRSKKHVKEWVFTYPPELIVQGDGKAILPGMDPLKQQGKPELIVQGDDKAILPGMDPLKQQGKPELIVQGDDKAILPGMDPLQQQGKHENDAIGKQEIKTGN